MVAVGLCWWFTRRYWGWRAAALATVVYASMPWAIIFSFRIWPNTLLPPFVMIWAVGCGLAFGEKRPRWVMLAWGAAWLALQLHVSGILLLVTLFAMMWLFRLPRAWRYALVGSALALLPTWPWLYAQATGAAQLGLDFTSTVGNVGLRINFQKTIQFLAARDLAANFISEGRDQLVAQLAYMHYLAPIWLLLYLGSLLFLVWRVRRAVAKQRPLYLFLPIRYVFSFGFTIVTDASYTLVYYLPMLPVPCIALAVMWQQLTERRPKLRWVVASVLLVLCALNLNAVWSIEQYIRSKIRKMDVMGHALSLDSLVYPPPLVWQMEIAGAIHLLLDAGEASELIMIQHILQDESHRHLRRPFSYHLRGYEVRVVNIYGPHLVYPERAALYLRNETDVSHNGGYAEEFEFRREVGPYHLYRLPGNVAPAPQILLPERPAYENGQRLLGYDALRCDGNWQPALDTWPARQGGRTSAFFRPFVEC